MSINLPPELDWVARLAVGDSWPKGDEDKLHSLGEAWEDAARQLSAMTREMDHVTLAVLKSVGGSVADSFAGSMQQLHSVLPEMAQGAGQLGELGRNTAVQVQYAKLMILAQLIWMAYELMQLAFLAPELIPAVVTGVRAIVKLILKRMLMSIAAGVGFMVGMDAAIQSIQMFLLHDRTKWDVSLTLQGAQGGALGGAIGGLFAGTGEAFFPKFANSLIGKGLEGGASSVTTTLAEQGIFGGESDMGAAVTSGVIGAFGGGGGKKKGDEKKQTDVEVPNVHLPQRETFSLLNIPVSTRTEDSKSDLFAGDNSASAGNSGQGRGTDGGVGAGNGKLHPDVTIDGGPAGDVPGADSPLTGASDTAVSGAEDKGAQYPGSRAITAAASAGVSGGQGTNGPLAAGGSVQGPSRTGTGKPGSGGMTAVGGTGADAPGGTNWMGETPHRPSTESTHLTTAGSSGTPPTVTPQHAGSVAGSGRGTSSAHPATLHSGVPDSASAAVHAGTGAPTTPQHQTVTATEAGTQVTTTSPHAGAATSPGSAAPGTALGAAVQTTPAPLAEGTPAETPAGTPSETRAVTHTAPGAETPATAPTPVPASAPAPAAADAVRNDTGEGTHGDLGAGTASGPHHAPAGDGPRTQRPDAAVTPDVGAPANAVAQGSAALHDPRNGPSAPQGFPGRAGGDGAAGTEGGTTQPAAPHGASARPAFTASHAHSPSADERGLARAGRPADTTGPGTAPAPPGGERATNRQSAGAGTAPAAPRVSTVAGMQTPGTRTVDPAARSGHDSGRSWEADAPPVPSVGVSPAEPPRHTPGMAPGGEERVSGPAGVASTGDGPGTAAPPRPAAQSPGQASAEQRHGTRQGAEVPPGRPRGQTASAPASGGTDDEHRGPTAGEEDVAWIRHEVVRQIRRTDPEGTRLEAADVTEAAVRRHLAEIRAEGLGGASPAEASAVVHRLLGVDRPRLLGGAPQTSPAEGPVASGSGSGRPSQRPPSAATASARDKATADHPPFTSAAGPSHRPAPAAARPEGEESRPAAAAQSGIPTRKGKEPLRAPARPQDDPTSERGPRKQRDEPPAQTDRQPRPPALPRRFGNRLTLGGMDVMEQFESGDRALAAVRELILSEGGETVWARERERVTALFSDEGLRPRAPGMLRGDRQLTHVVRVGPSRHLTVSLSLKGEDPASRLSYKDEIGSYEFEQSSEPTSAVSRLTEKRGTVLGGAQVGFSHSTVNNTFSVTGSWEQQRSVTTQRADRQISGSQTTESATRFEGSVRAELSRRIGTGPARDVDEIDFRTRVAVPTRDVLDRDPTPANPASAETPGPLTGDVRLQTPPHVAERYALSASDVVTDLRLTADGTHGGTTSVRALLDGASMRDAFDTAYGRRARDAREEIAGLLTVESLQAHLHGMTNKQPLVLHLRSVPGGRVEVHASIERLDTESAPPAGARRGEPSMRITGDTGKTEFHHGTETDTSRNVQNQVTWAGGVQNRLRMPGSAEQAVAGGGADNAHSMSQADDQGDVRQFRQRSTLKTQAKGRALEGQARLRFELHPPAGSGHGSGRRTGAAQGTDRTPAAIPEENRGPVASPVTRPPAAPPTPTDTRQAFRGVVRETRARFGLLMEQSQADPAPSAGFMGQTVWAPPQRLWRLEAAPVRTNSTTRQYWWHPGRPPAASPEGAGQVGGAQRQEVPRGTDTSAPLRGLGSLDRVTNLDLSGFHGMLEVMGRQAFGGRWNTSRDEVTDWFHLSRVRASLPGMTRHTPLTWTGRSGHATSASFTADFHELTFRRTIKTLSSPSAETTRGVTTTRSDAAQHGAQLALGGRGGDIAGGNVLGEVIAGSTRVTRDGDRQRELERTVVATKFDVEMAVFDGWVRLDGTLSGPRGTVRDSGLFPVQIAVPFGDLLGSRVHDSPEAPVFTAERPSGFVPQARRKMLALAEAHAAARAATAPAGTAKADKLSPPPQRAPERDLNIAPEAQSSGAGAKADLGPKAVTGPSNRHATDPFVPKDAPSSARHVPEPPPLDWTPPAQRENPPPPPAHALAHAWHPADMLLGVDPADGLLSAIRQDLAPVLGRSLDREMRGVEEQFGADVLTARLTHESGQEWSHDISVTGGHITVRVRPVREATYEYVGHSKDFETDLSVESQSSRAHLRNEVPRVVVGGRVQVPVAPNVSLAVQVTHSTSATPGRGGEWPSREGRNHAPQQSGTHPAAARDGGDGLAGTGQAGELAGERDDRTPLRIKNLQPHNLYRQPIRFEISYEKHLGARLLSGVPAAPLPVRLNGVFSYPSAPPAVSGRTPAGPAALPDGLGADHVVLTLRPHAPASGGVLPGPANQDATRRAPTDQPPAPDQGRGSRRTPDEDLVAAHVLDGVDESGSGLFGKDWERVRAELTPHVRTMALQEQLGTLSRGRSETVRLTSVDGASVELRLRVESLTETKAPGSTEFYDGRQSALSSSDAHTRSSAWQAYVQVQSDLLPSGAPVNGSVLGRLEGGWGKEGLDGRGNSGMSGLLLRRKVAATAHVGLASIEVRMTRPGASGQRDRSVTYAGSRLEFTTVRAPKDAADAPLLPRPGILPDRTADGGGRALMDGRGEPVPARGLSRDTVVRSIARGDDVRSQVSAHLRDTLGSKRAALIQESVEQALDDTRLAGGLTAMTRGEEVELYRSGDLRVTAEAHVQDMVFRHLESKGATANVLNEVNQSRVRRSGTFREAGGRFLAGPVFKAASLKAGLLVGGGGNGRWRTAIGNTQNSKVSAYAKFARPYAAFDGRMQVTVKVTQDSRTSTLRPVDVEGQILLPVSETQPAPLAPPTLSPPPAPREEAHTEVSEVPEPAPSQGEGTRRTRRADTSPSGAPEPERPEQARRQAGPAQFSAPDDAAQTTSADHPARTEAADVDTRTRPAAGKPTDEPATRNTGADPRETAERATTTKQSKTPQPDPRGIPDPRHRPTVQAAMEPATGPATGPPQERPGHPPREEPRTSPHPAPSTPAEIPEPTRTTDLGRFDITEGPVELSPRQVVHLHQMAVTVAQHAVANTVQGVPLPRVVVVGESDGTRGGLTHFGQGVRNGGDLAHTLAQQFRGILQERLNILQTGRVRAVTADNIEISAVSRTLGPPDGIVGSPRRSAHFSMHLPRLTRQAATAGEHASGARGGQSSPAHSRGPEPSLRPGPPREPETSPAPESSMSRSTAPSRQPAGTATSTPQAAEQSEQHTTDTTGSQQEATPRAPAEPRPQRRASAGQGTGAQGSYPPSGSRPLGAGVERHPERHRDLPSPSEPVEQVTPAPVAPGGGAAPGASPAPQRRGTSPDSTGAGASHDPAGPGPRPVQSPDPKSPDGRR